MNAFFDSLSHYPFIEELAADGPCSGATLIADYNRNPRGAVYSSAPNGGEHSVLQSCEVHGFCID